LQSSNLLSVSSVSLWLIPLLCSFIVLDSSSESFLKSNLRFVLEHLARQANICQGIAHITRARRLKDRFHTHTERLVDTIHQLQQSKGLAARDIDRAPNRRRRISREQIGLHHVIDVNKVARLFAVAKNRRPTARHHLRDEFWNNGRVLALGILP